MTKYVRDNTDVKVISRREKNLLRFVIKYSYQISMKPFFPTVGL